MNISAPTFELRSLFALPKLPSKKEFQAALARIKAQSKEGLARALAKVANPAEIAELTNAEVRTLKDLLVLAMSMTRRGFLKVLGRAGSLLGLTPNLPQLPKATDDAAIKAIQILNSRNYTIPNLMKQFLEINTDHFDQIRTLLKENSKASAAKLLEMIRTMPPREELARVCSAAITGDFSKLTHLDWGSANYLAAILRDDGVITIETTVARPFLFAHFMPRTGITVRHLETLGAIKRHCQSLPCEYSLNEESKQTDKNVVNSFPLAPYMQSLVTSRASGENPREHFEQIQYDYQAPSPEYGD